MSRKRIEGESFETYKAAIRSERRTLDTYLRGIVVVPGREVNRKTIRDIQNRSKHHGSHGKFYTGS